MPIERIDNDTRMIVLKLIRKYEGYKMWYTAERQSIISPGIKENDGMPHGTTVSDPTITAVERLDKLEHSRRAEVIRAIDTARDRIAQTVDSPEQQNRLKRAIWLSCINGRLYNFEAFAGSIPCERRQFYNYKRQFLVDVKKQLDL